MTRSDPAPPTAAVLSMSSHVGSGLQEPLGQLLEQPALAGQLHALGLSPTHQLISSISQSSTDFGGTASDRSAVSASVTLLLVIDAPSMIGSYTERLQSPVNATADFMIRRAAAPVISSGVNVRIRWFSEHAHHARCVDRSRGTRGSCIDHERC